MRWREAMQRALYGPDGFYVRPGTGPAGHFRTSAHASSVFTSAVARLLEHVDDALGSPQRLDVVDVGAGRGELLTAMAAVLPETLLSRSRLTAVELAPRPQSLAATIGWVPEPPPSVVGLLVATEWLDNVPLDLAAGAPPRYLHVDGSLGAPVAGSDAHWLRTWWPLPLDLPGARAEIGAARDAAWAAAVSTVERGLALTVDYGHLRGERPVGGTLAGYRAGRVVEPVPDGTCDLTAHVALDAVAAAGSVTAGQPAVLRTQREALRALGVHGGRPPVAAAYTDPAGYLSALAAASIGGELTDPAGLGGHWWLLQPVRLPDRGNDLWSYRR